MSWSMPENTFLGLFASHHNSIKQGTIIINIQLELYRGIGKSMALSTYSFELLMLCFPVLGRRGVQDGFSV